MAARKGLMSQGPYRAGHQRMFMGAMDKWAGQQPRSHLRKRDFESELLERLLSHGMKGERAKSPCLTPLLRKPGCAYYRIPV